MIKRSLALLCVGMSVLVLGGCASPSGTSKGALTVEELFKRADTDGDGKISRQEFATFMIEDVFRRYDRNGDGFITETEFVAGGGTPENFRKINRSGSGKITLQEAKSSKLILDRMAIPFDEADVNGNGYVSWEEYSKARERAQPYIR